MIHFDLIALVEVLETLDAATVQRDDVHVGLVLAQRAQRLGEFGLLESIGSEDGDALSGEMAHGVCSFSGEERPP